MQVNIITGDITQFSGDAIVNAAKVTLEGGGGVDGAIHRAAGPKLKEACCALPVSMTMPDGTLIRCEVGQARLTAGFDLPAKHVIHTVGPIWPSENAPTHPGGYRQYRPAEALIVKAIYASFKLAKHHNLHSVAFPAISCGIFGGDVGQFGYGMAAILNMTDWQPIQSVTVYLFDDAQREQFRKGYENALNARRPLWKRLLGVGRVTVA